MGAGPGQRAELTEAIYRTASTSQIATVQKLLSRPEAKQLVKHDRSQHVHVFEAAITREAFAGKQLEKMAERLTEGSLVPFLTHMVQARGAQRRKPDLTSQTARRHHEKAREVAMTYLIEIVVSNAVIATLLAILVACITQSGTTIAHALWLLVLLKLVTPPVVPVELFAVADRQKLRPALQQSIGENDPRPRYYCRVKRWSEAWGSRGTGVESCK